jgi:hypothetical protein
MSEQTLEARVAALEARVAELTRLVKPATARPGRPATWAELLNRPPLPPDLHEAFDAMNAYGRYYRRTGKEPPADWKPGDPIPEPDDLP